MSSRWKDGQRTQSIILPTASQIFSGAECFHGSLTSVDGVQNQTVQHGVGAGDNQFVCKTLLVLSTYCSNPVRLRVSVVMRTLAVRESAMIAAAQAAESIHWMDYK